MLACFVLDVHPSMGRRSAPSSSGPGPQQARNLRGAGLSSLEWAKSAVEYFIKSRQKANFKDQYFLLTTEEGPGCVRAAWGDSLQRVDDQLRLLAPLPADGSKGGTDVNNALSKAFALMNQYRMQRSTDNYGQGRCPWLIEPGCCLFFTDGECLRASPPSSSSAGSAAGAAAGAGAGAGAASGDKALFTKFQLHLTTPREELTRDPYRWDQRFFPLVIQQPASTNPPLAAADGEKHKNTAFDGATAATAATASAATAVATSFPPIGILKALSEQTGGYYSVSDSLMGLNMKMDLVLHKLSHVGPVVILAAETSPEQQQASLQTAAGGGGGGGGGGAGGGGSSNCIGASPSSSDGTLTSSSSSPPQPAAVRAVLSLTPETTFIWPIPEAFWLERALEHLPRRDAQPTLLYRRLAPDSNDPALVGIQLLEEQGLDMDRYPLEWCGNGLGMKMTRDARWPVYLLDSSRQKGQRGNPFGYLEASELAGRVTLVLLPYNYPKLAELTKQAVERGSATGHLTSLPVKWRPEFNQYLAQTPPYYYPSLRRCLKKIGLHSQVPENKTGGLSQVVAKRLQRLREQALEENQRYEASRSEHPRHNRGVLMNRGDGSSSSNNSIGGGLDGSLQALSSSLSQSGGSSLGLGNMAEAGGGNNNTNNNGTDKQQDLLSLWESMRHRLFGERGHVTSGLYLKGLKSWRGACGASKARRDDWTLLGEVGAQQVPENPIMQMGSYTEMLLQMEMFRDPLAEPDPDEDNPEAWLQRKLQVNFGNPFSKQGGAGSGKGVVRVMLSAEAENEAAVLGPHSSLGEDLEEGEEGEKGGEGEGEGKEGEGQKKETEGALKDVKDGEDQEGGGSATSTLDSAGQPARKRQRMNELPPLPKAKKLRRSHHPLPSSSSSSSAAAQHSHGAGGSVAGSGGAANKSVLGPHMTPMATGMGGEGYSSSAYGGDLSRASEQGEEEYAMEWGDLPEEAGDGEANEEEQRQQEEERKEHKKTAAAKTTATTKATKAKTEAAAETATAASASTKAKSSSSKSGVSANTPAAAPASASATAAPSAKGETTTTTTTTATGTTTTPKRRSVEELRADKTLAKPNAEGWMLAWSNREKRLYYFNTKTNISMWQAPPGLPPINEDA